MDIAADTDGAVSMDQGTALENSHRQATSSLNIPRWNMEVSGSQVPAQGQSESAQTDAVYNVEWLQKQMAGRNSGETVVPNSRILRRLFSSAMAHRLRAQSPHKYRNALLLKDHLDILYTIFQGKAPLETANPFLLSLIEEYKKMKPVETTRTSNSCMTSTTAATASTVTTPLSSTSTTVQAPVDNFSADKEGSCTIQTQQKDSSIDAEKQAGNPKAVQTSRDEENRGDRQTVEAGDDSTKTAACDPANKVPPKKGMIRMGNRCYSCFECYDVFKNSIELRMHFLLHHPSRLPYIDGEDDNLEARQVIQATVERGEHVDFHSISLQFPGITKEEFLRTKNSCMSLKDKIQTTVQGLLPLTHSIKFVQNPVSVTTVDSAGVTKSMLNGGGELSNGNRETALDLSAKGNSDVNIGGVERKPCVPFHNCESLEAENSTSSVSKVQNAKAPTQLTVKVKREPNDLHEYGHDLQDEEGSRAPPKLLQEKVKKETVDKGVDPMPLSIYLKQANAANTDTEKTMELLKGPSGNLQIPDTKMGIKRRLEDHDEGYLVEKTSSTRRKNTRPKRMRVDSSSWEEASTGTRTEMAMEGIQPWADQAGKGVRKTLTASENSSSNFVNIVGEEVGSLDKSAKGKTAALFKVKVCVDCNKTFRSHVDLKMHVLRNHPEKLPLLNWPADDFPSTNPPHESEPAGEEGRPGLIYCTECESTFKMFMDLKMHVMQVHPEKLPDFEWPNRDQMRKRGNPYRRSKRAKQPSRKMKRGRSRSPKGRSNEREMTGPRSEKPEEEQFAQDGSLDLRVKKSVKKEVSSEILDLSVPKVPRSITEMNNYSSPSADGPLPSTLYEQFTQLVPGRKRGHRCSLCHETFALLVERKMHDLQCHPEKLSDFDLRDVQRPSTTTEHELVDLWTKEVPRGRGKNKYTRKCPMCTKEFRSLTMLKKHVLAKHPGGLAEVCRDSAPASDDSVLSFVPPSRVKSTYKGASGCNLNEIIAANTKVHRARAMKRKCPACGAYFKALSRLKQHVLLEHPSKLGEVCEPDDEPPYRPPSSSAHKVVSCSECGAGFGTPIELKSHFLKQHPSKFTDVLKPLASDLPIVKRFGDQFVVLKDSLLYRHMCEECGMGFSTQEAKMTHLQVEHHSQGNSYSAALQVLVNTRSTMFRGKMHLCPQCGTGFSTEIERKRHVLEHHPGQFAKFADVIDPLSLKMTEPVSGEGDKTKLMQLSKLTGYSKKTLWGIPCPANCEMRCKTWLDLKKHVLMHHPSWFGEVCRYSQEDITKLVLEKTSAVKEEKSSIPSEDLENGNIEKTLSTGHRLIQAALLGSSVQPSEVKNDKVVNQEYGVKKERVDHSTSSSNGMTQTNGKGESMEKTNTRHVRRHWCPECHMPFSNFLDLKFHVMMKHPSKLLTLNVPEKKTQEQPAFSSGAEPVENKESQDTLPSTTLHSVLHKDCNKRMTEETDLTHEELTLTEQVQVHGTTKRLLLPKPGKAWTKSQLIRQKQKSLSEEATKTKYSRKVRWQCPECKSLFDHFLGLKAHAVESHSFMLPLLDPETTKIRLDRKASKDFMGQTETVQSTR